MKKTLTFDMSDPIERADLIKIKLRNAGVTTLVLAETLELSQAFVGDVINSRRASARVQTAIAEQIGEQVEEIWPVRRGRAIRM